VCKKCQSLCFLLSLWVLVGFIVWVGVDGFPLGLHFGLSVGSMLAKDSFGFGCHQRNV
jgi:hypothetical protein